MNRGFSLVELSIVLVILGLLTGGILTGQSLIRAAELRSITADHQRYVAAIQSFRDKYMATPGDMNNATRFWNRQINDASCATNSGAAVTPPGTCDGNGDGRLSALPTSNELFQFWRQLAHAGVIEGSYSGLQQGTTNFSAVGGVNTPAGRISSSGWYAGASFSFSGHGYWFDGDYNRYLIFGLNVVDTHQGYAITPEETWNIDTKIDDGRPGIGKVTTANWNVCTTAATSADSATAQYDFTIKSLSCSPTFLNAF